MSDDYAKFNLAREEKLLARIAELEAKNNGLLDQHARDSKELRAICEQRDEYLVTSRRLQADKRALLQGHEEQASEISRLIGEAGAKAARIAELEAENKRLETALDAAKHLWGSGVSEVDRLESVNDRLRAELASKAGEVEVMRAGIERALTRARVFDDGSDGADGESARSCVDTLSALLAQPAGSWINPLASEVEKLRADAERYRWLRYCNLDRHNGLRRAIDFGALYMDAAIDAARKGEGSEG